MAFCSICNKLGIVHETAEDYYSLVACKYKNCSKRYHLACLTKPSVFSGLIEKVNKLNMSDEDSLVGRLMCPIHCCFKCGEKIYKTSNRNLHGCIRCPKVFHPKCVNKEEFINLHGFYYICLSHLPPSAVVSLQN